MTEHDKRDPAEAQRDKELMTEFFSADPAPTPEEVADIEALAKKSYAEAFPPPAPTFDKESLDCPGGAASSSGVSTPAPSFEELLMDCLLARLALQDASNVEGRRCPHRMKLQEIFEDAYANVVARYEEMVRAHAKSCLRHATLQKKHEGLEADYTRACEQLRATLEEEGE